MPLSFFVFRSNRPPIDFRSDHVLKLTDNDNKDGMEKELNGNNSLEFDAAVCSADIRVLSV